LLSAQKLAREYTPQAIEALVRGLNDPKHYVAAAIALLDRGWGRPNVRIETDHPDGISIAHLVAATAFGEQLAAERNVIDGTAITDKPRFVIDLSTQPFE
jgi:hypothetical protein